MRFETFAHLDGFPHAFTLRDPGDDTRASIFSAQIAKTFGYSGYAMAEQPHGYGVAFVKQPGFFPGVDALITRQCDLPLLLRCADCAPVFLINRRLPAIALIHSGKQGTLANIAGHTVRVLPGVPQDWQAFIGPSIGPCHYELDLWAGIETQLRDAGIVEIHNPRICTACHLDQYYSYRAERGQTGRMFALLALPPATEFSGAKVDTVNKSHAQPSNRHQGTNEACAPNLNEVSKRSFCDDAPERLFTAGSKQCCSTVLVNIQLNMRMLIPVRYCPAKASNPGFFQRAFDVI